MMGTILEHIQAHRDNVVVVANPTDITDVTTTTNTALIMVDPVDTVVQLVVVSQPFFQIVPSRFVASYPLGNSS